GGGAAHQGLDVGEAAGPRRRVAGQVDRDGRTAVARVIQRVRARTPVDLARDAPARVEDERIVPRPAGQVLDGGAAARADGAGVGPGQGPGAGAVGPDERVGAGGAADQRLDVGEAAGAGGGAGGEVDRGGGAAVGRVVQGVGARAAVDRPRD